MRTKLIPDSLYRQILKSVPVPCVDLVVCHRHEFLLTKRVNQPAKNEWHMIGGRILKNEQVLTAVKRKLWEEAGIKKVELIQFLGFDQTFYKKGRYGDPVHTVNLVFKVVIKEKNNHIRGGDGQIKWYDRVNPNWQSYTRRSLKRANIK